MQVFDMSSIFQASRMKWEFDSPEENHNVKEPQKGKLKDIIIEYCTCTMSNKKILKGKLCTSL